MRSLILAIALIFMPVMAFGQQIQLGVNIGVHQVHPRVHPRVHHRYSPHQPIVRPSVVHPRVYVYPPIYIHPSPYTIPYSGGYNYHPYGSYHHNRSRSGTGIYFQFQLR